nr:hypothetical protein [uncultured Mediterranean phage uvMED]
MTDGPSQITDIGGLPYGDKEKMEGLASEGGVSLGMQGDTNVAGTPAIVAPQPPENFNVGNVSDYVANAANQGGLASDGLPFGQGMGPAAPEITELEQQRKSAVDNALEIYANTKIPAVRVAAAKIIQGAVISQMQGDDG